MLLCTQYLPKYQIITRILLKKKTTLNLQFYHQSKILPRNQALNSNAQIPRAHLMDLLQPTEPCLRQTKELKFAATEQKISHKLGIYTKIEVSSGFS